MAGIYTFAQFWYDVQTDMTKYSLPEPDDEGVGTGTGRRKRRVDRRPSFRSISKRFIETAQQARAENRFCRSLPLAYPGRLDLDCRRLSRMPHANRNVSVAPCALQRSSERANVVELLDKSKKRPPETITLDPERQRSSIERDRKRHNGVKEGDHTSLRNQTSFVLPDLATGS
jgi:hypothetical protein